jgi:hypothetical protein
VSCGHYWQQRRLTIKQIDCDRFQTCSANICPFEDAELAKKRKHLNGERVCFYLIEAQKSGAKAIFDKCGRAYLYQLIQDAMPNIVARHSIIKRVLENAKKTGSRMDRKIGVAL